MIYSVNNRSYRSSDNNVDIFGNAAQSLIHPYYERMDIVLADFGEEYENCVVGDFRPAVVISKTSYNTFSPVMQVIPLTKQLKSVDKEYHVFVDRDDCEGFEASGMCLVEQITTIDRRQVRRKIASVKTPGLIDKIDSAIKNHLGLFREEL